MADEAPLRPTIFDQVYGQPNPLSPVSKGTFWCTSCLRPFDAEIKQNGKPRYVEDYKALREKLMILVEDHDPEFCDVCYRIVMFHQSPMSTHPPMVAK